MPNADGALTRQEVRLLIADVQHLAAWKALRNALVHEREQRVNQIVYGRAPLDRIQGLAGEVRGIDVVIQAMTTTNAKHETPQEEPA
jgi:hypothetical protein